MPLPPCLEKAEKERAVSYLANAGSSMLDAIFRAGCLFRWDRRLPYWVLGIEATIVVACTQHLLGTPAVSSEGSEDLPLAALVAHLRAAQAPQPR